MRAVRKSRVVPAFALAWTAMWLSIGSGQDKKPEQARTGERPEVVASATLHVLPPPPARSSAPESTAGKPDAPRPPLVLIAVNGGDEVTLVPERDDGGFRAEDLRRAAVAFSQQTPGKVHPLAPRLLDLVYRAMRHFDAKVVRVVSGYRRDRAGSRHTQGRAVDMAIDGVPNDRLAAWARELGFVGVGYYPLSGFVHIDVREASYFWIDDSAPNSPSHLVPVFEDQARRADAAARARGEKPDVYVPNNRKEDAAAAKVYARKARERRAAARRRR